MEHGRTTGQEFEDIVKRTAEVLSKSLRPKEERSEKSRMENQEVQGRGAMSGRAGGMKGPRAEG